jgi:hypothetical protein
MHFIQIHKITMHIKFQITAFQLAKPYKTYTLAGFEPMIEIFRILLSRYWAHESSPLNHFTVEEQHQQQHHQQQQLQGTSSGNLLRSGLQSGGTIYNMENSEELHNSPVRGNHHHPRSALASRGQSSSFLDRRRSLGKVRP